jgi:hypothetical protein
MDFWILGVGALVLIGLAVWIVWPTAAAPVVEPAKAGEFEDEYTSATADLSAAGVATALRSEPGAMTLPPAEEAAAAMIFEGPGERLSSAPAAASATRAPILARSGAVDIVPAARSSSRVTRIATAIALTFGGAIGGAWIYSRWQQQRAKRASRLRRWFFR